MPYCPKCDMEFVDGITTCTDCKEPLVESKEVADALKLQELEEADTRQEAAYREMQAAMEAEQDAFAGAALEEADKTAKSGSAFAGNSVYIRKSQQYDDLKSSAMAFLLVGAGLLVFSLLCWLNMIRLPFEGISRSISQSVMSLMSIGALLVAYSSNQKAKTVHTQIAEEEDTTNALVLWFTGSYTGENLDAQILAESGEMGEGELSLKRFELIQDILVTSHDIANPSYVDLIAEDIYGTLYQD